ncbi:MAG: tRNA (adenosine(37)-N6)-threonylcarbamoyltransferase complex dimerization subunit type 1 TsaB [Terricaulis sp.]
MNAAGAVFACDTTLDACSVALVRGDESWALSEPMQRGQAERLAPMAAEALAQSGLKWSDVTRIVVTTGPGSFTGVRVGLSFARALALALKAPCVGVSTLEALALEQGSDGSRAALIETPGAAYLALYRHGAPLIAPCPIERGAHLALIKGAAGDAAFLLRGPAETCDPVALARYGAARDPALYPPDPLYLRAPHVTLPAGAS